jgi:hypothetical protein
MKLIAYYYGSAAGERLESDELVMIATRTDPLLGPRELQACRQVR